MSKLKKLLSLLIASTIISTLSLPQALAIDVDPSDEPIIDDLDVSDNTFDPSKGEHTTFSFELTQDTDLTAFVAHKDTDDNDEIVANGEYDFIVFAEEDGSVVDSDSVEVEVDSELSTIPLNCNSAVIDNFEINPDSDWDPTDEELDIEFDLEIDVDELRVQATKGNEIIEIDDFSSADEDNYETEWDGEDDDNDYIEDGSWDIEVIADNYKCVETVDVEYIEPKIEEALVTKESFDLDYDEFTSLLFEMDEDGIVTVEVYDGSKKVETLIDEEELEGDVWHEVFFDGRDDDGDELDDDEKYEFRITTESIGNSSEEDTEDVSFEIEEDDSSNKSGNIYGDYLEPAIFDPKHDESITIHYCLDDSADVTIEIFDGENASGSEEATLLEDNAQSAGCHTVEWNGVKENDKVLSDDIYSYKITAQDGSSKNTEEGVFVVGEFESSTGSSSSSNNVYTSSNLGLASILNTGVVGLSCGNFTDTYNITDEELCSAINWASAYGIINGNEDGSLKPYSPINRAETVKMVFSVYPQVTLESAYESDFIDIDEDAWYAPYIVTAQSYGIMQGYKNGNNEYEAKPAQAVTRAEVLKIVYTASTTFAGYSYQLAGSSSLPWYSPYESLAYQHNVYDAQSAVNFNGAAQRHEVIVFLYRLAQAGLL